MESRSKNYLTMSLEEIAEGKIKYEYKRYRANWPAPCRQWPVARVLLGVTGGIAAYKACELSRLLVKGGHEVIPLVTRGPSASSARETFEALARRAAARGSVSPPRPRPTCS